MKKTLHELAHGTDKSWAHQYIHVYQALFEPIRTKVTQVLELGIWDGGSIRMWRDYFEKAQVTGMDIADRVKGMEGESRITAIFTDAYTMEAVNSFTTKFDVVVDDGPHTLESQKFCAAHYSSLLSSKGILVIEDIPDPSWIPQIAEVVPEHLKPFMYGIDRRIAPNRQSINDELMFVIDLRYT